MKLYVCIRVCVREGFLIRMETQILSRRVNRFYLYAPRLFNIPISLGIVPISDSPTIVRSCRFMRSPISVGIVPDTWNNFKDAVCVCSSSKRRRRSCE